MQNAIGTYRTSRKAIFAAFDALPPAIRKEFREALDDWVPQPLAKLLAQGTPQDVIIFTIRRWNQEEKSAHWARMNRMANFGIPYFTPEGQARKMEANARRARATSSVDELFSLLTEPTPTRSL